MMSISKRRRINSSMILCISALVTIASLSSKVAACEYHSQPSFGAFGQMPSFGQRHVSNSSTSQLRLNHTRAIVTSVEKPQTIDIKYHLPVEYEQVSLRFTSSEGLELGTTESVSLDQLNGVYTLAFTPKEVGKNHIMVWVDATRNSLPYSKVQRIKIAVN